MKAFWSTKGNLSATSFIVDIVLFCAGIFLLSSSAFAQQTREIADGNGYRGSNYFNRLDVNQTSAAMNRNADYVQNVVDGHMQSGQRGAGVCGLGSDFGQMFTKEYVDIRVVFGYKDVHPGFVDDNETKQALINHLMTPCRRDQNMPGAYAACGFARERNPQNPNVDTLGKWMSYPNAGRYYFRIQLAHSAATRDDSINKMQGRAAQDRQTAIAQGLFVDGLQMADMVLYNGHARSGGGPDFRPSRLLRDNINVDFPSYRAERHGVGLLREGLQGRRVTPQLPVLALFACVSTSLFGPTIQQLSPGTTIYSNPRVNWWDDEIITIPAMINAALSQLCRPTTLQTVNNPSIDPNSQIAITPARTR